MNEHVAGQLARPNSRVFRGVKMLTAQEWLYASLCTLRSIFHKKYAGFLDELLEIIIHNIMPYFTYFLEFSSRAYLTSMIIVLDVGAI